MANAFNACSRDTLLHRTRKHLPELFSWVQWCYTCVGELRFGSHRIGSSAGVQQGDPLGPILFSLALLGLTENLREHDGICLSLWYLDDGTIIGTRTAVRQVLDRLLVNGPRFGLHLNLSKCEIYWPSGDQAFPEFPAEVTRIGELQHGVELLGLPVFGDDEFFLYCRWPSRLQSPSTPGGFGPPTRGAAPSPELSQHLQDQPPSPHGTPKCCRYQMVAL